MAAGAAPKGSIGLTPALEAFEEPIFRLEVVVEDEEKLPKLDQLFVDWFCTGLVPVVGHGLVFNWVKLDAPKIFENTNLSKSSRRNKIEVWGQKSNNIDKNLTSKAVSKKQAWKSFSNYDLANKSIQAD